MILGDQIDDTLNLRRWSFHIVSGNNLFQPNLQFRKKMIFEIPT